MIIIMMILMIIIILHHGADDYNHMAMQGDLQLGLHDGGYLMIERAGWPANLQNQAFHWLFSKSTTVIGVNNAKGSTAPLTRFHSWHNWQRAWQSDASARREEQRQRAK